MNSYWAEYDKVFIITQADLTTLPSERQKSPTRPWKVLTK